MSMWKEIGKNILKGSAIAYGTRVVTEKVIPAATDFSKEAWDRIKKTKSTGVEEEPVEEPTEIVNGKKHRVVYDADYTNKKDKSV